jgi:hypothetical protein
MEEKRKDLLVAGLYLGDVTLALAAIAKDLPSYVQGFDLERVIPEAGELEPARSEVDSLLAGRNELDEIPPGLLKTILDTAIEKGKFHSATRCLEILGERGAYVERFIASAAGKIESGDMAGAARDISIASNLESETGFPLFQYSGPELHAGCATAPGECLTRAQADDAVARAVDYLLEGEKVIAFAGGLGADERKSLFPHLALERDPGLREFYAAFSGAHTVLSEIEVGELQVLRSDLRTAGEAARDLENQLGGASPSGGGTPALERARRMASGLAKDFEGTDSLLDNLQLRRIKRRVGNLLESESELRAAGEALQGGGEGTPLGRAIGLMEELRGKGVVEKIDEMESRLVGLQVGLLGRPVHSQEHWQYLRELAFKYPVSPVLCCIRKLNDRYMVVPMWDSDLAVILRDFLE